LKTRAQHLRFGLDNVLLVGSDNNESWLVGHVIAYFATGFDELLVVQVELVLDLISLCQLVLVLVLD